MKGLICYSLARLKGAETTVARGAAAVAEAEAAVAEAEAAALAAVVAVEEEAVAIEAATIEAVATKVVVTDMVARAAKPNSAIFRMPTCQLNLQPQDFPLSPG